MTPSMARVAILIAFTSQSDTAATLAWTDWDSATAGLEGAASGILNVAGELVTVTYSGEIFFAQTSGGTNYWLPNTAYLSAEVENGPPDSDVIAIIGGTSSLNTLTFSRPIRDPVLAVLSIGQLAVPVNYVFDAPFKLRSSGIGSFGEGPLLNLEGNTLRGNEGHGLIQFTGIFDSISWTVPLPENWHGFQVGGATVSGDSVEPTPEPGTVGMALLGFSVFLGYRRHSRV